MSENAKRMMRLFAGYAGAYGTHGEPVQREGSLKWEIRATARTLREPVTVELWRQHLAGTKPLGIIAIREDSRCNWGSIDYDVYDADLTAIIRRAQQLEITLVPCRSKSGGLHLFLFLEQPAAAAEVVEVLRELAARIGASGSEIFPKQTRIMEDRGDLGSWIVMPYFGSTYDGRLREQVGLRVTGAEMTTEEFLRAAEKARVTPAKLAEHVVARRKRGANGKAPAGVAFGDGPPCLQHLAAQKVAPGGQNNALLMMGIYYKRVSPENWKALLDEAGRTHLETPASTESMQSIVRSLEKKEYEYTCSTEPMVSHCNVRLCRTRQFGVGSWGEYPLLSGMSVMLTDPVIWFVDVDGERVEVGTNDLTNYVKFHALCMERLRRCYKLMRQDSWLKQLHEAMEGMVAVDPPPDTEQGARFRELLEEFLINRARGQRKEDLLSGRPWDNEEKGRLEFRLRDLETFLARESFEGLTRGKLTREIKRLHGDSAGHNILGKYVNVWYVPSSIFTPIPKVSVPDGVVPKEVM